MTSIRQLRECHRTAKKLQFFLDRDPFAPLSDEDRRRVQAHLAECEKCSTLSSEYQALHVSLQQLGSSMTPEPQVVDRVKVALNRALEAEGN